MTRQEAITYIRTFGATDTVPVLSAAQVGALVDTARRADSAGRAPSDADWEPTFHLSPAVAEAWRLKAGMAASLVDVSTPEVKLSRQQQHTACMAMAKEWQRKGAGSLHVRPRYDVVPEVPGQNAELIP